jgi:hypothetical protein
MTRVCKDVTRDPVAAGIVFFMRDTSKTKREINALHSSTIINKTLQQEILVTSITGTPFFNFTTIYRLGIFLYVYGFLQINDFLISFYDMW